MPNIGYLNGQFLPLEEVRVSVEDRGFQFGDGVYEVIRVYSGKPFYLEHHLVRLRNSAAAIHLPITIDGNWGAIISQAIRLSQYSNCKVYIQITRGVAPREHVFPAIDSPTIVMTVREILPLDPVLVENGVAAITLPDLRWGRCSIKSLNLLPNVLAKQEAKQKGAFEAIFVRGELITEGTASNVMIFDGQKLQTPPVNDDILAGVTRQIVLQLAATEGIKVEECPIPLNNFRNAQEVFLVGTTVEVLSVVQLDGKTVGEGKPGKISRLLLSRFQSLTQQLSE